MSQAAENTDGPIQIIPKIIRWCNKHRTKGGKRKKWANGSMNARTKPKTDAALLVEQAISYGFLNGRRIYRKRK